MVFSSLTFLLLFFPAVMFTYYIVPVRFCEPVLLLFSLVFYAWGEPVYIFLILFSIGINYVCGLAMEKEPDKAKNHLIYAVTVNLFILAFFKYYGFLLDSFNTLFHTHIPVKRLPLPIGISFYTFQVLSYIIDLYRGKIRCQKNIIRFGLYISMFPQLIAGPIVRYSEIEGELGRREFSLPQFGKGCQLFLFGLCKKVLLANNIGIVFNEIHSISSGSMSCVTAWIGAVAFSLQLYFDFSGYSDMAIGLGRMLGFTFPQNFRYPYLASSVTDFWRRWHISLGTWFREYLYIPLGGNRVPWWKHIRNILIVWLLTGLWHGANWNFVLWGLYYALFLLFEKYVINRILAAGIPGINILYRFFTLLVVITGWVLFSSDTAAQIPGTLCAMIGQNGSGLCDSTGLYYLSVSWKWLAAGIFFCTPLSIRLWNNLALRNRKICLAVCAVLFFVCMINLVSQNYNPFLYFRF